MAGAPPMICAWPGCSAALEGLTVLWAGDLPYCESHHARLGACPSEAGCTKKIPLHRVRCAEHSSEVCPMWGDGEYPAIGGLL